MLRIFLVFASLLSLSAQAALPDQRLHPDDATRAAWERSRESLTAPLWGNRPAWTKAVIDVVNARIGDLDRAADVEAWCPGYRAATPSEQNNCWLLLVAAVSQRESSFRTGDAFLEPEGMQSIGLLALSPGECPNAPTAQDLTDAVKNLVCGVNKLAYLVARDGMIDGSKFSADGKETERARGGSAYWSTLKPRHLREVPERNRTYTLGFKTEIQAITRKYKLPR